jgi:hypothetical protein
MKTRIWPCAILALLPIACLAQAQEQPPTFDHMPKGMHVRMLHNVHVVGKILTGGTSSGDDGRDHLMVGVKLDKPLSGGVDSVMATVTHNEPSQRVQISIGIYSGHAPQVGRVDVTCPSVRVLTFHGKSTAMGEECTFNSYKGPLIKQ